MRKFYVHDSENKLHTLDADFFETEGDFIIFYRRTMTLPTRTTGFFRPLSVIETF